MPRWPQHRDQAPVHHATAPYNFVPLPERVLTVGSGPFAAHDRLADDRLHGWVDLEITTEAPVYTRCAWPPEADPRGDTSALRCGVKAEFFYHEAPNGQPIPVLPGSTLRGMVRNLVEILSYSRLTRRNQPGGSMARVVDQQLVYRAVADQRTPMGKYYNERFLKVLGPNHVQVPGPGILAGWLQDDGHGGHHIRPALCHHGQTFIKVNLKKLEPFPSLGASRLLIRKDDNPADFKPLRLYLRPEAPKDWTSTNKPNLRLREARAQEVLDRPNPDLVEAWIVPSGEIQGRHMLTAVYPADPTATTIPIPDEPMWEKWLEDCRLQRGLPNRLVPEHKSEPIFYLVESGRLVFFGPTLFFRIPYRSFTLDQVPPATLGNQEAELDLAESLFGTVIPGKREGGVSRGRVTFEPATCATPDPYLAGEDGLRYPGVLSAPKPTSPQLYLVQPKDANARVAEFAHKGEKAPEESRKEQLSGWDDRPPSTTLRGFKRYWHRKDVPDLRQPASIQVADPGLFQQAPGDKASQFTRIRPVKRGVAFRGCLRFENLTPMELGALLAALELPASCRHQIGMGKPLGLGSVRVATTAHLVDAVARYASLGGVGELPPTQALPKLQETRDAFRQAVIGHHNDSVVTPQIPEGGALWDIPRLQALKLLLEYDGAPPRVKTRNQALKDFRSRKILPSPFQVMGRETPKVEADVPPAAAGTVAAAAAPLGPIVPVPGAGQTPLAAGAATPASAEVPGRIVRLMGADIEVSPEGRAPIKLRQDIRIFPIDLWKKFNQVEFKPGRTVTISFDGERVVRVVPRKG